MRGGFIMLGKIEATMARRVLPFHVEVSKPCSESWDTMSGAVRQRHCGVCHKQVHNFAAMTPREIERLVAETGGHLCGRITRRGDGSLVTLEPTQQRQRFAALTLSAALGIAPAAVAQTGSPTQQVQGQQTSSSGAAAFSLTGTVRDIQGGLISGADVVIASGSASIARTKTDAAGAFAVLLPAGEYQLRATAVGFSHSSCKRRCT